MERGDKELKALFMASTELCSPNLKSDTKHENIESNIPFDKANKTKLDINRNGPISSEVNGTFLSEEQKEGTLKQRSAKPETNFENRNGLLKTELPTISEIKAAIPKHCFKATIPKSVYYVFKDLFFIAVLMLMGHCILRTEVLSIQVILSPLYWFAQGTLFFAVFVLGHDCNHGSFSSYAFFNDCLGTVLHTVVMTPYYPWKLSHRHHHNNTGNMDKDEIFYPIRERDDNKNNFAPFFGLGIGWLAYLWRGFGPRRMNHWIPVHPIFSKHAIGCVLSVISVISWVGILSYISRITGWANIIYHYVIPVFVCGGYIVVVTFLHHSDLELPWYSDDSWDNVKGKLSSVDRDYGFIHDIIHTIGTHQVHHLFPIIPHYNLREATTHFRKAFPHLVHINKKHILPAFMEMFYKYTSQCIVSNDTKIHYYK